MEVLLAFCLGVMFGVLLDQLAIPWTVDQYVRARRRGW